MVSTITSTKNVFVIIFCNFKGVTFKIFVTSLDTAGCINFINIKLPNTPNNTKT